MIKGRIVVEKNKPPFLPSNCPVHQSSVDAVFFVTVISSPLRKERSDSLSPSKSYRAVARTNRFGIGGGAGRLVVIEVDDEVDEVEDRVGGWRAAT